MKILYSVLNETRIQEEIILDNLKIRWTNGYKELVKWVKDHMQDFMVDASDLTINAARDFYNQNPRKRNYEAGVRVYVKALRDCQDSTIDIYKKLYNRYKDIGIDWIWTDNVHDIYKGNTKLKLDDKRKLDSIEPKIYTSESFGAVRDKEFGNGYNSLPGTLAEQYREKLLDCIKSSKVIKIIEKGGFIKDNYTIIYKIIPEYDKSKLEKLYSEVMGSKELQKYADRLESMSRGIANYYDEKRASGDHYTGD